MGVASSKLEDDKALLLCRGRKRFVRQALDGRCSLAAAHIAYIQSLKNTGTALRKFVEPDPPVESSLYTSTSATTEPLASTDKSLSRFSYSTSSLSQHVEQDESHSPATSSPSGRFHVNYMRTGGNSSATVEERPPVAATATLVSSSGTPQNHTPRSAETRPSFEVPSPRPRTPGWDFFGLFHPIDDQFSFSHGRELNHEFENTDDIQRLREEEGIPDLEEEDIPDSEEEGERVAFIRRAAVYEPEVSDDEYVEPSDKLPFQSSNNRNDGLDSYSSNVSPILQSLRSRTEKTDHLDIENKMAKGSMDDAGGESETPDITPMRRTPLVSHPDNDYRGMEKEPTSQNKPAPKDFLSSVKEIEYLFIKASESGNVIPRMLEANKVHHHRPIFPETKARTSSASILFRTCLVCLEDPEQIPQEPAKNAVKYLTWHRSASSRSSSFRNLLVKDNVDGSNSNLFNNFCMNSGSHASTLERLYAWERKLYDEIKASGIIRRQYDRKCKLLRHQDSKGESPYKIDKTRAIVKDLHSRITVAIYRINSISKKIEELRDKELQPQLEELIGGLSQMWEMMLESHKLQLNIISIAYINGSTKISIQSESHRQAAIHLEDVLNSLCSSFKKLISVHKSYLHAINNWLLSCVFPLQQKSSRGRQMPFSPRRFVAPPVFVTCRDWLKGLEHLEKEVAVADSITELIMVTTLFLPQQVRTHRKKLTSTFSSVSWEANDSNKRVQIDRNEATVDWNSCFQGLQSSLVGFFSHLNDFADASTKMYADLQQSIKEAHQRYDQMSQ
ncbi:DUF632 domain-containing protein/DUF630 domain-containing protein [Cinnamomum micranthum f. kanehirae]|uniref:DUF632 domain-containing protein/DUF630 domain-containing protein n=1 Tax=Cinnamomum micranthum f. kanehirae TaxID=337451 RepID=A0A443NME0_9MAGN|nr:DUF632 domain-containing protein/DUF630 domain-containing protein [Cinnamomum micranthum f. kanehirae]